MVATLPLYQLAASGGPVTVGGSQFSPVKRTVAERFNSRVFNVKDFGANGDGSTDDSDAIYGALIYAYQLFNHPLDGGTIFFPPGTYRIGNPVAALFISPSIYLETTTGGTAGTTTSVTFNFLPSALKIGMVTLGNSFGSNPFPDGTQITNIDLVNKILTFSNPANTNFSASTFMLITVTKDGTVQGFVRLVGAGRDTSIIRGSINNFMVQVLQTSGGAYCTGMADLTIWNENTGTNSGGYIDFSNMNNWTSYDNCTFVGYVAAHLGWQSFGISAKNCRFLNSSLVSTASPTGPPPVSVFPIVGQGTIPTGSVGLYFSEGEIENCSAIGFDTGYALSQNTVTFNGNRASRCNVGLDLGHAFNPAGHVIFPGQVDLISNIFDRCGIGLVEYAGPGVRFSNIICGNLANNIKTGQPVGSNTDGVLTPAAINSITVGGGVANAITQQPHGLGSSGQVFLELITNPASLTPDASGNQVVLVTLTGVSQFQYSLSGSGSFGSPGTWNTPLSVGVCGAKYQGTTYCSNLLTARAVNGSFALEDLTNFQSSNDVTKANFVCATAGPYGWLGPNTGNDTNQSMITNFHYEMCGLPASASLSITPAAALPNPISVLKFAGLTDTFSARFDGKEVNITDGQKSGGGAATFGDVLAGSGTQHVKGRYNAATGNWTRSG